MVLLLLLQQLSMATAPGDLQDGQGHHLGDTQPFIPPGQPTPDKILQIAVEDDDDELLMADAKVGTPV